MTETQKWIRLGYCSLFIILHFFLLVNSNDIGQLTICGQPSTEELPNSLVYVSTLDGKISALDPGNNGEKQWSLDFHQGPMLSSNIHRRELNNNGQWVRLIPSLSGGLYKFDGESLESVPISAEQLLHSSFRYSDDLVFSGGKETRSYGVSSRTGKILYECGIYGCTNNTDGEGQHDQDVLVIKRFQQTVRAVEPRTGVERWNFSVGQHHLVLVPQQKIYCHNRKNMPDIEIKVIVPDGLIWAVSKNNPSVKLWQYKFDSPIVTIWHQDAPRSSNEPGSLKEINLFDSSQWSWGAEYSASPGIYVGMHDRQLYIQENTEILKSLQASPKYVQLTKYPWLPYPAIGTAVANSLQNPSSDKQSDIVALEIREAQSTTALSVLYNSEYINGNGFYLYSKDQLSIDRNKQCNTTDPNLLLIESQDEQAYTNNYTQEDDTPVQVIIVSLWYWWKEVLIISITTAILLNFMLTQRLLNATTVAKDAVLPPLIIERHIETQKNVIPNGSETDMIDNFKSRYLNDFEPVDCLGKGGYGVVFEAKNKIDDCNYAIKRIALPNSQYSRDRVMREVKALAKLEHHNIVRYFNAWLECPPAGWQEKHDEQWTSKLHSPSSDFPSGLTTTETKLNNSVCITVSQTDQLSVDSACEAYALNAVNEDSFIVFEKPRSLGQDANVIDISDCSTQSSEVSLSDDMAEEIISNLNESACSDSIVFENSPSKGSNDRCSVELNKTPDESKDRKRSISLNLNLNLNNKSRTRKSAKMFLYIQMQLCQRFSLREWLKQQSTRDPRRVLNIFQQIVDAVEYVHLQGLIHRDLKPSNIFFAFDDKIKVGDFGLVTAMTEGYGEQHTPAPENEKVTFKASLHTACVGTHLYMSPEQMNGQSYNYKVDIYSLGIILLELLIPFLTEMERIDALMNLKKSIFPKDFESNHPAEYKLLRMMLDENPDKRPTTLGIKARPPFVNAETTNELNATEDSKWHFELPQLSRHSSVTNSSSGESWENIS